MTELLKDRDFLFGLVALVAGIICIIKAAYERKTAVRLPGKVTGNSQDGRGNYYPVVSFTYRGQEYHIPGANGSGKPKYAEGDSVEVLYRPSNQKYVNIVGNNYDIVLSILFILCGVCLVVAQFL